MLKRGLRALYGAQVALLEELLAAGMHLAQPCQQGKEESSSGDALAVRICSAPALDEGGRAALLARLARFGWMPSSAKARQGVRALLERCAGGNSGDVTALSQCLEAAQTAERADGSTPAGTVNAHATRPPPL